MIDRRELIIAAAGITVGQATARSMRGLREPGAVPIDDATLAEAGIAELRGWIDRGELTVTELVQAARRRVDVLDPFFGAVIR